jgi:hypothetical protein
MPAKKEEKEALLIRYDEGERRVEVRRGRRRTIEDQVYKLNRFAAFIKSPTYFSIEYEKPEKILVAGDR